MDNEKVADEVARPTCPICLELPLNAMVGTCGHTLCESCRNTARSKCPFCNKMVKFTPNYMVRSLLEHPRFREEMSVLVREKVTATVEGRLKAQYKDFHIYENGFPAAETNILLELFECYCQLSDRDAGEICTRFADIRRNYNHPAMSLFCMEVNKYAYCLRGGEYYLRVRMNNSSFVVISRKKHWAKQ